MSGGGKRTALKMLEDEGFYCVDNLPVDLLDKFVEIISSPGSEHEHVALGLDVRSTQKFDDVQEALHKLKEEGNNFEVLFMDCDDATLVRRYKESRRMHLRRILYAAYKPHYRLSATYNARKSLFQNCQIGMKS